MTRLPGKTCLKFCLAALAFSKPHCYSILTKDVCFIFLCFCNHLQSQANFYTGWSDSINLRENAIQKIVGNCVGDITQRGGNRCNPDPERKEMTFVTSSMGLLNGSGICMNLLNYWQVLFEVSETWPRNPSTPICFCIVISACLSFCTRLYYCHFPSVI